MTNVSIPTLKRTDFSRNCWWANVSSYGTRNQKRPHEEILRASHNCFMRDDWPDKGMWEYTFSLEHIHSQHHYSGDKLRFLKKYNIGRVSNCYILTNVCGAIFLQLANGTISYNEAAKAAEKETTYDYTGKITLDDEKGGI